MAQIYENNLWDGNKAELYSVIGLNHPETVNPYIAVISTFLKDFETPLVICYQSR